MSEYLKKALERSDEDVASVQNGMKEMQRSGTIMNAEAYVEEEGRIRCAYVESDRIGGILFELIEVKP